LRRHASISTAIFTTKTYSGNFQLDGRNVIIMPSALYCYTVGRNITAKLETLLSAEIVAELPAVLQTLPPVREDIEHEYNEDDQL
jgi:hypothetical protein